MSLLFIQNSVGGWIFPKIKVGCGGWCDCGGRCARGAAVNIGDVLTLDVDNWFRSVPNCGGNSRGCFKPKQPGFSRTNSFLPPLAALCEPRRRWSPPGIGHRGTGQGGLGTVSTFRPVAQPTRQTKKQGLSRWQKRPCFKCGITNNELMRGEDLEGILISRTSHFTHTTILHELRPIARTEKPNLLIRKTTSTGRAVWSCHRWRGGSRSL